MVWLTPDTAYAQSVDNCMTAKGEEAVQTCQALLSKGNRSAEIYYQLSSQLYQLGRTSEALSILEKGLAIHKANSLLLTLRSTLVTDSEEQAALRASAQKNEAVMNRGQLKLTCLTKTSRAGLSACEAYLAQTNVDGDKIRARAQTITAALVPAQPEPVPIPQIAAAPVVENQIPPTIQPDETYQAPVAEPAPIKPAPLDPAVIALRGLIREIQTGLLSLGFNVGVPDGISGPRTRTAVQQFYELTRQSSSDRLDDQTLDDIQAAIADLDAANELFDKSRIAAANQQFDEAMLLFTSAERTSILFKAPTGYLQNLNLQLARETQVPPTTPTNNTASVTKPSTFEPNSTADDVKVSLPTETQPPEFASRINALTATLALRRANGLRQNQAMRDVVSNLFQ